MQLNGLTLAYIGDAKWELMVRDYLIQKGFKKVDNLHKEAIQFTSAVSQAACFNKIESVLTEQEVLMFKKGRNAKTDRKAKNASLADYQKATGFESLIGYLHINNKQDRLQELFELIISE